MVGRLDPAVGSGDAYGSMKGAMRSSKSLILLGLLLSLWSVSEVVAESDRVLADRVVAAVDEDVILMSDLDTLIELGLAERAEGESEPDFRRRLLDALIDQKLRFHEIDRFGFSEVPVAEVERAYEEYRQRFDNDVEFRRRLAAVDLDEAALRRLFARQIMVLAYVDERLGARVFVSLEDIQDYYAEVLVPSLKATGEEVPPQSEVREEIRAVIKEARLNDEIDRWTEELRAEADVVDYLDGEPGELPPVVVSTGDAAGGR